jgi:hypothetical protein
MKLRTALFLACLVLLTGAVFAENPRRVIAPDLRIVDEFPRERDPQDRVSQGMKVPYIFDGVQFTADTPLPDYPLTYVLTHDDVHNGTIHVFSSHDVAKEFMKRNPPRTRSLGAFGDVVINSSHCTWTNGYSWFNTAVGCGNSGFLELYPPDSHSHLDFGGWNNTISCVKAACVTEYTVLYGCRNFQMWADSGCESPSRLYVDPGQIITDLNDYNFNNKTSSIRFE